MNWKDTLNRLLNAEKSALQEQFEECFGAESGAALFATFEGAGRSFSLMSGLDNETGEAAAKFLHWFFSE